MSAAFVPGRIRRDAPWSSLLLSSSCFPCSSDNGDFGWMKSSESGGGLGRRGEEEGDIADAMVAGAVCRETVQKVASPTIRRVLLAYSRGCAYSYALLEHAP